jgi:hypothetical protein
MLVPVVSNEYLHKRTCVTEAHLNTIPISIITSCASNECNGNLVVVYNLCILFQRYSV